MREQKGALTMQHTLYLSYWKRRAQACVELVVYLSGLANDLLDAIGSTLQCLVMERMEEARA
jgi:hypothetical protein